MTKQNVFIYDLAKQSIKKKLITSSKFLSNFALHSSGEHLLVSTYDKKALWFDLDSSEKPFRTFATHSKAVRQVQYSDSFGLFATCSDDGNIFVQHCKIDTETFSDPIITPLTVIHSHANSSEDLGVIDFRFLKGKHWMASVGSNEKIQIMA